MTRGIHIIPLMLGLLAAGGCATSLSEQEFASLVREAPLVACDQLTEVNGMTTWQGHPFTGRTVLYEVFGGFNLALYQKGKRVPEERLVGYWIPTFMPEEATHPEYYRPAFLAYARSKYGFAHDEYVRIIKYGYGEIEDVPKMIRGLEYWGDVTNNATVVCSRDHCLEALKLVTGANPGPNAADWRRWWEEHQPKKTE